MTVGTDKLTNSSWKKSVQVRSPIGDYFWEFFLERKPIGNLLIPVDFSQK